VLKLVKKMSPARAKTPAVSTRTGRKRRRPAGLDPVPGESAELLNVPLSPSAPRKHYANGRPGEHFSVPLYAALGPPQFPARPRSASTGETLVPKSRIRKKADYTPPPTKQATNIKLNSRGWVAPVMLALFVMGLAWIVVFYVTDGSLPMDSLGNWNIVVGFGFIAAGFGVSTQWK